MHMTLYRLSIIMANWRILNSVHVLVLSLSFLTLCAGHGRLVDPAGRASAWRYGFNTPANYDDNQMYCGGKQVQWNQNGGRCGICGDPFRGPRLHEAGGKFATGTIVKSYKPGQVIPVTVELTANHKGWMEFRLCKNDNPNRRVTQGCLNSGLLPLANGRGTRFPVSSDIRTVTVSLQLPRDLTCSQCLLQWKYNAGNSWGVDMETGRACVGCGPQEQFYGCADVSIGQHPGAMPNKPVSRPKTENLNEGGQILTADQGDMPMHAANCRATGSWSSNTGMDKWCRDNCSRGHCPSTHCICT